MPYCSQQDVENAAGGTEDLRQLSDWNGTNAIDAAIIADKIDEVERWIDSYARLHYVVPFNDVGAGSNEVPDAIRRLCAREVRYRLAEPRRMAVAWEKQHDEDLEWLRDLSRGRVRLTVNPPEQSPAASGGQTAAAAGTIERLDLEGFV